SMKFSKLFSLALMAASALSMSAQGIEFMPHEARLQEAIDKAKKEGKMVFLDCYTSWCGPCKMMANKIFPTQEVGDFMNPKFVSIKIDMEKGEGPEIAERLQINAYPTFVIFNNDGTEAARFVGGGDAQNFIKRVNDNISNNGPAAMEARFKAGDRDRQFMLDYLEYLGKVYRTQQANVVAEAILEGQTETFAADTTLRKVFVKHIINPYAPSFVYAAKNRESMATLIGEKAYNDKIGSVLNRYSRSIVRKNGNSFTLDQKKLDDFIAHIKECNIPRPEHYRLNTLMSYAERNGDWNTYMDVMESYLADSSLDMPDMTLSFKSASLIEKCQDQQVRARIKKVLQTRVDDIKSGRRTAQTLPAGRQKQTPLEMLENNLKSLN
ncbi:MAG: thioredoxin family protein, partial [Duncaniella sp.]|nr:thioredoxin family protein [Duncaniella sp.]